VDLGVELEVIQKSGSWFAYNGNKLGQGRDSVKQLIEDNPELMDELELKIKAKISGNAVNKEEAKEAKKEEAKEARELKRAAEEKVK
jgi:recombination protein RecA